MKDILIGKPETIQEILVNATRALGATMSYRDARLQAELLLAQSLGISRAHLLARSTDRVAPEIAAQFAGRVARRAQHEPLAYILGHQYFYGLDFLVDQRVLIPRHETELLVHLALQQIQRVNNLMPVIVDIGTGSGAIALTLAHYLLHAQIHAIELSADALTVARVNAKRLGLTERVKFSKSDLLTRFDEPVDVVVANLPYIPSARFKTLPREIREFEPPIALEGGADGFAIIRRMFPQLGTLARRGTCALFEISEEQGSAAREMFAKQFPRAQVKLHQDLEGLDRIIQVDF